MLAACMNLHLLMLNGNSHLVLHAITMEWSSCQVRLSKDDVIMLNSLVSSANI